MAEKTRRRYLKGDSRRKRSVDMEEAYVMLDAGKTVKEVAAYFGVSCTTLYRRHHEYQEMIASAEDSRGDGLPPIPENL